MTINSPYKSPVRLVAYAGEMIRPYSGYSLAVAKNKLLQEVDGRPDITIERITYSEEEIISLLDNQNEESWHQHLLIYSLKGLLVFLEKNSFDDSLMSKVSQFRYNPGFVRFVSPWFAEVFNIVSARFIEEKDLDQLNLLFNYSSFMITPDKTGGFSAVNNYFDELKASLQDLDFDKFRENVSMLDFIHSSSWLSFMNQPDVMNSESRNGVIKQILHILINIQGKASWQYISGLIKKLQSLVINEDIQTELDEYASEVHHHSLAKENENENKLKQLLIWGGIATAITLLIFSLIYFSSGSKKESDETAENEYHKTVEKEYLPPPMETENSIVKDELKSSTIEQQFKSFLYQIAYQNYRGKTLSPDNGTNPIEGVTRLPGKIGSVPLTITNNCRLDALIFYFNDKNVLSNKNSRVYAAYIKSGGSFSMNIDPNFGRLNIVFGHDWITLREPFKFFFSRDRDVKTKTKAADTWVLKEYFAYPSAFTRYIDHDINITDHKQASDQNYHVPLPKLIFEPDTYGYSKNSEQFVTLEIRENLGKPSLYGQGTFYIYESPLRF